MTHICVGKLTTIGSDGRRQAIIWTNAGLLLIGPLGTNFSEILIGILTFSFKKLHLKVSSAKWRPFCLGLNVLNTWLAFALVIEFQCSRKRVTHCNTNIEIHRNHICLRYSGWELCLYSPATTWLYNTHHCTQRSIPAQFVLVYCGQVPTIFTWLLYENAGSRRDRRVFVKIWWKWIIQHAENWNNCGVLRWSSMG